MIFQKECKLYSWVKDKVRRGVIAGMPEWYKGELLKRQFGSQ